MSRIQWDFTISIIQQLEKAKQILSWSCRIPCTNVAAHKSMIFCQNWLHFFERSTVIKAVIKDCLERLPNLNCHQKTAYFPLLSSNTFQLTMPSQLIKFFNLECHQGLPNLDYLQRLPNLDYHQKLPNLDYHQSCFLRNYSKKSSRILKQSSKVFFQEHVLNTLAKHPSTVCPKKFSLQKHSSKKLFKKVF